MAFKSIREIDKVDVLKKICNALVKERFLLGMNEKVEIMDEITLHRSLARITHEIIEKNHELHNIVILGIKRRGVEIATILKNNLKKFENIDVPFGYVDVTMHRDDYSTEMKKEKMTDSYVPCDINRKTVIIVDDVLFTGRTARAAIETIFSYGRPKDVQLAVLVDRGHRELPIRPDYVGKNVPSSKNEHIQVLLESTDNKVGVYLERDVR